jgi:hypothetical protein
MALDPESGHRVDRASKIVAALAKQGVAVSDRA